jgi:hypothetical protein
VTYNHDHVRQINPDPHHPIDYTFSPMKLRMAVRIAPFQLFSGQRLPRVLVAIPFSPKNLGEWAKSNRFWFDLAVCCRFSVFIDHSVTRSGLDSSSMPSRTRVFTRCELPNDFIELIFLLVLCWDLDPALPIYPELSCRSKTNPLLSEWIIPSAFYSYFSPRHTLLSGAYPSICLAGKVHIL